MKYTFLCSAGVGNLNPAIWFFVLARSIPASFAITFISDLPDLNFLLYSAVTCKNVLSISGFSLINLSVAEVISKLVIPALVASSVVMIILPLVSALSIEFLPNIHAIVTLPSTKATAPSAGAISTTLIFDTFTLYSFMIILKA